MHLKYSYPACNLHHSGTPTPDMKRWFREGEVLHHARNFFPSSRVVLQVGVNLVVPIPVRHGFRKTDSWGHFLAVAQPCQLNLFWMEVIGTAHQHRRVLQWVQLDSGCSCKVTWKEKLMFHIFYKEKNTSTAFVFLDGKFFHCISKMSTLWITAHFWISCAVLQCC